MTTWCHFATDLSVSIDRGELRQRNLSLRVVVKEIPSVFGSFF